jgi:hypothetical protein
MFRHPKPCIWALLALAALLSQPTRASWAYGPPEHSVSAAYVVVTGTIAHVSWNKTKRGVRDGKKHKYRHRIARLKVEKVLKNDLLGVTVETGALLEFPIVRNRWGKPRGFEHEGFSCQKGDRGIWLLGYSDDTLQVYWPGARMPPAKLDEVRRILRGLDVSYQEALKEKIPTEARNRQEILAIPVYPRSKIDARVGDGKGLPPGVDPAEVYVLNPRRKPMETLFLDIRGQVLGGVPYHASASAFSEGRLRVSTRVESNVYAGYRSMDRDGKLFTELPHGGQPSSASGSAAEQYPDSSGREYVADKAFKGGFAKVWIRETHPRKGGFIDREGNLIFPPVVAQFSDYSEGLVAFREHKKTDKWGYMDTEGKVVITPRFLRARDFSDGRAAVDYSWWIKRPPLFNRGGSTVRLSSKAPRHFLGTRRGYIDRAGNLINPIGFDGADDFRNGLARVNRYLNRKVTHRFDGIMDREGRIVLVLSNPLANTADGEGK